MISVTKKQTVLNVKIGYLIPTLVAGKNIKTNCGVERKKLNKQKENKRAHIRKNPASKFSKPYQRILILIYAELKPNTEANE